MSFPADSHAPRRGEHGLRTVAVNPPRVGPAPPVTRPRQLEHDIEHELATIALLASLLSSAEDVGPDSRRRAQQIVEETQWLSRLLGAALSRSSPSWADSCVRRDTSVVAGRSTPPDDADRPVRLDRIATDVVSAARLSTGAGVHLHATETWAAVDPLTFWRVLTNLANNAVRAAGPHGEVVIHVSTENDRAVVQVEDDGPGFGAGPAGSRAQGLDITRSLVLSMAGELQIGTGAGGGCRVRLRLPVPPSGLGEGRVV
jgi:signal transduction histidine kinase